MPLLQNNFIKHSLLLAVLLLSGISIQAQTSDSLNRASEVWVDSVFNSLNQEERIAQLMLVRANDPGKPYDKRVDKWIKKYNIGGVTFFKGGPVAQAKVTNKWQAEAKTPLLISIDGEWGLAMRLDSTISYPLQMTLGAIEDDSLIYRMGKQIAEECHRIGIQLNFAPVVDINSNPKNPVIGMRSFGSDKHDVSEKGMAYMNGLQNEGILATAKHFPGHGDTDMDSHKTLPVIPHDSIRLDSVELYPFKKLINSGLRGIMIAHLYMPAFEIQENTPTTLSYNVTTKLLQQKLGFNGLVVTDGLEMQGVRKYYKAGEIEVKALQAGNDILLLPPEVPTAIKAIQNAIKEGRLSDSLINERCKKVLKYKYMAGLNIVQPIKIEGIYEDLNSKKGQRLRSELFEKAITLVQNHDSIIPLSQERKHGIAALTIGYSYPTTFQKTLEEYTDVAFYNTGKIPSAEQQKGLMKELQKYNTIIIGLENTNISPSKNFGVSKEAIQFINQLKPQLHKNVILDIFTAPYVLKDIEAENFDAILVSYQDKVDAKKASAQIIFGGLPAMGHLPASADSLFPIGTGITTSKTRIAYHPSMYGDLESKGIHEVDSIIDYAYKHKAFPGCQVIALKDGDLFLERNIGYHTGKQKIKVKEADLYDIASITKIAATTLAIMKLSEEGVIDIDRRLSDYLLFLKNSNKKDLIIRDIMAHQAGLKPWFAFYKNTVTPAGSPSKEIYHRKSSEAYPTRVANDIYIKKDFERILVDTIINSKLDSCYKFQYSDLGFYLLPQLVELATNQNFENYLYHNFYEPLGLKSTTFLPRHYFKKDKIVPTEIDDYFRDQLIDGDVHDPGAAMLGGVSGHAGLFSSARDLAVIMQMLMNGGTYGGKRYLEAATINDFTRVQFPMNENRRGAGFDKPLLEFHEHGPNCYSARPSSFGHSGFTGTYAWADPETGLVYIFLSNRVYPNSRNKELLKEDIRTNIHESLYKAIGKEKIKENITEDK